MYVMIALFVQGKSTLALLLTDDVSLVGQLKLGQYKIIQKKEGQSTSPIGNKTTVSHTTFPEPYVDKNGVVYYDCPGFGDSRQKTPHIELAIAIFIKRVAMYAEKIKVLFVVNFFSLGPNSDRRDFPEALGYVNELFSMTTFKDSFGMVVTKVTQPEFTDDEITQNIADFLSEVRSELPETTSEDKLEQSQQLIDELLKRDSSGHLSRISLFRAPNAVGPLAKQEYIMKNKEDILQMVRSIKMTSHEKKGIGFALSAGARLLTRDVHAELSTRTEEKVRRWSTLCEDYFEASLGSISLLDSSAKREVKDKFEIFHLATKLNLTARDDILDFMKKFKPSISLEIENEVENNIKTLQFLEEVDEGIKKAGWSASKEKLHASAEGIVHNVRDLHTKTFLRIEEAARTLFAATKKNLTEDVLRLVNQDAVDVDARMTGLEEKLAQLTRIHTDPDLGNRTKWYRQQVLLTEKRFDIDVQKMVFDFLEELLPTCSANQPSQPTIAGIFEKFINELYSSIWQLLKKEVFPSAKSKFEEMLKEMTGNLKSQYALAFPSADLSSQTELRTFVQREKGCITSRHKIDQEQPNTADTNQYLNDTLLAISCFSLSRNDSKHERLCQRIPPPVRIMMMDVILDTSNVDIKGNLDGMFQLHLWQPMMNFFNAFESAMRDVAKKYDEKSQELIVQGNILSLNEVLEDVKKEPYYGNIRRLSVVATHTVFIDAELSGVEMNRQGNVDLGIVSAIWWVAPGHLINLNGRPGGKHPQRSRNFGEDGKPGLHGENAGNFFGLGMDFRGTNLSVFARGGDGGPGEDGMIGYQGSDGWEAKDNNVKCTQGGLSHEVEIHGANFGFEKGCVTNRFSYLPLDDSGYSIYGGPGSPGGDGGNGGKAGSPGFGGQLLVLIVPVLNQSAADPKESTSHTKFDDGTVGADGKGGEGGKGGRTGRIWYYTSEVITSVGAIIAAIYSVGITSAFDIGGITCKLTLMYSTNDWLDDEYVMSGTAGSSGTVPQISVPSRPTYSPSGNGKLLDMLKLSAIRLSQSTDQDEYLLLQPIMQKFIQRSDSLSNLPEFTNTLRLYEEHTFLEKAASMETFEFADDTSVVRTELYTSLESRVAELLRFTTDANSTKALKFLHAAVLSQLARMKQQLGPLLVVDIKAYLNIMKELGRSWQEKEGQAGRSFLIGKLRESYDQDIKAKTTEASKVLTQSLRPQVDRVVGNLQAKLKLLEEKITEALQGTRDKLEASREEERVARNLLGVRILMSTLQFGLSVLPTPESKVLSTVTNIAMGVLDKGTDVIASSGTPENLEAIRTEIRNLENQVSALENHQKRVGEKSPQIIVTLRNHLGKFAGTLKSKSSASLVLSKLEIKSFLSSIKVMARTELTTGYERSDQEVERCFELMENLFTIMIELYDRMHGYDDQRKLADYMADFQEAGPSWFIGFDDPKLKQAIADTDKLLALNSLVISYRTVASSFVLWAFPFASYFESELRLPMASTNRTTESLQGVAFDIVDRINVLERKVAEFYATITPFDRFRHQKLFKGSNNVGSNAALTDSFYVWQDQDVIARLLNGEKLVLTPKLQKGPLNMDAIRFKTLRLDFKSLDKNLEEALVKELNASFSVVMTHMGDSHFWCTGQVSSLQRFVGLLAWF
jgi:hypothetical protein